MWKQTGIQLDSGTPERPEPQKALADTDLRITVIFTSEKLTRAALRTAGLLAGQLKACIDLVVPQVVPYPLPLNCPPVACQLNEQRLLALAQETTVASLLVVLCRNPVEVLSTALEPHSLIVLGVPRGWWHLRENRMARALSRAGHTVIFTRTE